MSPSATAAATATEQPPATSRAGGDAVCLAAVDLARAAAEEMSRTAGAHVGVEVDGERVVTHLFECTDPAYRGWRWGVQVVRAARAKEPTVNGAYRLPGPDALLPPAWVPWTERVRAGDLGVGDLLPAAPDDDRLVLSLEDTDSDLPLLEWGMGRPRVLSANGRLDAAERWYDGTAGPDTPIAREAPAPCRSCGFWVPLGGPLGQAFGACANEYAPDDGRVVAADHGCGAHSEGAVVAPEEPTPGLLLDEVGFDLLSDPTAAAAPTDDPDDPLALGHS